MKKEAGHTNAYFSSPILVNPFTVDLFWIFRLQSFQKFDGDIRAFGEFNRSILQCSSDLVW